MLKSPELENNAQSYIKIELDGNDFEGFGRRMVIVFGLVLGIKWFGDFDGGLVFMITCICWITYMLYRISYFKEDAYQQIIQDLEIRNKKLSKANELLQNVVNEKLGMRISTEE